MAFLTTGVPVGLLARNDLVRRSTSDFNGSFDGGVLLLPESFGGFSYFSSR